MLIATHSGRIDADQVFATALMLMKHANADIIRTRDEEQLRLADIRIDVGCRYLPPHDFDHHQKLNFVRDCGTPYAAAGLVMKYLEPIFPSREVFHIVDSRLIKGIDAHDNGIKVHQNNYPFSLYSIADVINSFNVGLTLDDTRDPSAQYAKFMQACWFAQDIIQKEIKQAKKRVQEASVVATAVRRASLEGKQYFILNKATSWRGVMTNFGYLEFVVFPDDFSDEWRIQAIPVHSYSKPHLLPSTWWGKYGFALKSITGVDGAIFCHKDGFLAGAATREAAIQLVEQATSN